MGVALWEMLEVTHNLPLSVKWIMNKIMKQSLLQKDMVLSCKCIDYWKRITHLNSVIYFKLCCIGAFSSMIVITPNSILYLNVYDASIKPIYQCLNIIWIFSWFEYMIDIQPFVHLLHFTNKLNHSLVI